MKFALLTNVISPHQLPLAEELVQRLGTSEYRYVHTEELESQRQQMGWGNSCGETWCIRAEKCGNVCEECSVLFSELRDFNLFQRRLSAGKTVCYVSERWFKPPLGFLRIFHPNYFRMAKKFFSFFRSESFYYFPQGIHAARDMARLCGLFAGDICCLFHAPALVFESKPGGRLLSYESAVRNGLLPEKERDFCKKNGFVQIPEIPLELSDDDPLLRHFRIWGYFVAPTERGERDVRIPKKVLWIGRMLDWKRVETIVQAIPDTMELHLYGHGPDESKIRKSAGGKQNIYFHDFVPIRQVRELMRQHDVYILSSDGGEGWGAVLCEAMEEKMRVLATHESGSGATILSEENLFPAKKSSELRKKLLLPIPFCAIGNWSVSYAADYLEKFLSQFQKSGNGIKKSC